MTIPKWLHKDLECTIDALADGIDESELEPGFSIDDESWEVQLKKGCRLLEISRQISDETGPLKQYEFYCLTIEIAFASMERTIQAYLLKKEIMTPDERIDKHSTCFEKAGRSGLLDETASKLMIELWSRYRSQLYYRHDIPSRIGANAMQSLAIKLHDYVIKTDDSLDTCCICKNRYKKETGD
jgi:hypothetical protein